MKEDIPMYLLSSVPDDESLDSIKLKRVVLNESLIGHPVDIKEFADTVVIFDDVDALTNKKIRQ